jgi:hypothetical protein
VEQCYLAIYSDAAAKCGERAGAGLNPDSESGRDSQQCADSYGGRLRGWVTAPQTGDYTFFIAGDDSAELWLSSDNSRFNRQLIAFSRNPTASEMVTDDLSEIHFAEMVTDDLSEIHFARAHSMA